MAKFISVLLLLAIGTAAAADCDATTVDDGCPAGACRAPSAYPDTCKNKPTYGFQGALCCKNSCNYENPDGSKCDVLGKPARCDAKLGPASWDCPVAQCSAGPEKYDDACKYVNRFAQAGDRCCAALCHLETPDGVKCEQLEALAAGDVCYSGGVTSTNGVIMNRKEDCPSSTKCKAVKGFAIGGEVDWTCQGPATKPACDDKTLCCPDGHTCMMPGGGSAKKCVGKADGIAPAVACEQTEVSCRTCGSGGFFDGCNTCGCSGGKAKCTRKFCAVKGNQYCKDPCAAKSCGDVCKRNPGGINLAVMTYCQFESSASKELVCATTKAKCPASCDGKTTCCSDGFTCMAPRGTNTTKQCISAGDRPGAAIPCRGPMYCYSLELFTPEKKNYCCKEKQIGCPDTYCMTRDKWSPKKQAYCCKEKQLGCPVDAACKGKAEDASCSQCPVATPPAVSSCFETMNLKTCQGGKCQSAKFSGCTCGEKCEMSGGATGACQTDGKTCAQNIMKPACKQAKFKCAAAAVWTQEEQTWCWEKRGLGGDRVCKNIRGWKDTDKYRCRQYKKCVDPGWEAMLKKKGPKYYSQWANKKTGLSARDACVKCGGGECMSLDSRGAAAFEVGADDAEEVAGFRDDTAEAPVTAGGEDVSGAATAGVTGVAAALLLLLPMLL